MIIIIIIIIITRYLFIYLFLYRIVSYVQTKMSLVYRILKIVPD